MVCYGVEKLQENDSVLGVSLMGKKLGKSVFTTGVAATTVLSGMFHHKASAEEVKQNENAETNSTEVVEKPITVDELKQITAQKGQVVKDVHYQEQKVIDAQTEVKAAGQELEEKKADVTDAENLIATTSNAQVQNAENDVKVAQAYVTIEENKVREAEAAHDQVVEAVRQQENQVTAQESLVDVAQNELNKAKVPISNDENVLAKSSKVFENLRVISRPCKQVSKLAQIQWLKLRAIFNWLKRV